MANGYTGISRLRRTVKFVDGKTGEANVRVEVALGAVPSPPFHVANQVETYDDHNRPIPGASYVVTDADKGEAVDDVIKQENAYFDHLGGTQRVVCGKCGRYRAVVQSGGGFGLARAALCLGCGEHKMVL